MHSVDQALVFCRHHWVELSRNGFQIVLRHRWLVALKAAKKRSLEFYSLPSREFLLPLGDVPDRFSVS